MRKISEMTVIQIEITNLCNRSCSNCTRFCGHYIKDKIFFISEDEFRKSLKTLKDYNGIVGMIGGEPSLHPNFNKLCEIFIEERPNKLTRGLWSNKTNFDINKNLYQKTFGYFNLNDHISTPIYHTPFLVSSKSIFNDTDVSTPELINWINNCWVQNTWSANITPKGAFFCEVAGMLDYLFDGPGGIDINENPDWWKLPLESYAEQINWACTKCGGALPLHSKNSNDIIDDISLDNLELLKKINSPKIKNGKYCLYDKGFDKSQIRNLIWYSNGNLPNCRKI